MPVAGSVSLAKPYSRPSQPLHVSGTEGIFSNALQERVLSTGGFAMSSLRTRTNNKRAEVQVLHEHNRKEIRQDAIDSASN